MSWQNRQVLVTGAAGFIGSHLVEYLLGEGASVRAFARYNSRASAGWLDDLEPRSRAAVEVVFGDLRDAESVTRAMTGCSVVMHLGALIAIPYSYVNPGGFVETNVLGTLNVLQAARSLEVERVVHTSTSEVYGTARYAPMDEEHPLQGQSPYSASKIGADKLVESFVRSFSLPAVTVRPFNTYGPRQSARAVIPTIISQALTRPEIHLGDLRPTRDLTFVADTVAGFARAGDPAVDVVGETINLGTGGETSIADLVETVFDVMGERKPVITEAERTRPAQSEVFRLISNPSKAEALLGWRAEHSLRAGLERTIDWVAAHLAFFDPTAYQL
jgi:dTDP-glucose 4,6-dehydratase